MRNVGSWKWILLSAGLLYAVHSPRLSVGSFGDDARDLLAATSLLQGHYVDLQSPDHPPLNFPLPGFPLLLAPFLALAGRHWALIKAIPIAAVLGSGAIFWNLLGPFVNHRRRLLLLALFLFNPTTLYLSGLVVADSFFLFLGLASFGWMNHLLHRPPKTHAWGLGGLLAWTTLVRPEGFLLVLAVSAGLWVAKRRRQALEAFMPAVNLLALFVIRNLLLTGEASGYSPLWQTSLKALSHTDQLLQHWSRISVVWFWDLLAGISWGAGAPAWALVCAVSVGLLCLWGFLQWLDQSHADRPLVLALGLFCGAYLALHAVWLAVHPHYLYPLLPFSLLFLTKTIQEGERRWRPTTALMILAAGLTGTAYAVQNVHQTISADGIHVENRIPLSTMDWMQSHIPLDPTHLVLAARAPAVTLYTQRYSIAFLPSPDADRFRFNLLSHGISHILVEPVPILFVAASGPLDPVNSWSQIATWVQQQPAAFPVVFKSDEGETIVYSVKTSPEDSAIYQHYQAAARLFGAHQMQEGMSEFDAAVVQYENLKKRELRGRN